MTIIEAAKKMNEGYEVKRPGWPTTKLHFGVVDEYHDTIPFILDQFDEAFCEFDTADLLATDWEIAQ